MRVTRQQARNDAEVQKNQPNTEVKVTSTIKVEEANSVEQEEIEHNSIACKMSEKFISTILSKNIDKLPKFAGKPDENVNKWLTEITNELNVAKLNDDQKRLVIHIFLLEDARKWFINNMNDIPDWSSFINRTQKAFSSAWLQEVAIKKVGARQQGLNETVMHYHNEMMELFDMIDINMDDHLKVIYLNTGLKLSLKKEVLRRKPKTAAEFLEIPQAEEQLDSSISVQMDDKEIGDANTFSLIRSNNRKYSQQQHRTQSNQHWQSTTASRYYRCNRVGHFARDCFAKNY